MKITRSVIMIVSLVVVVSLVAAAIFAQVRASCSDADAKLFCGEWKTYAVDISNPQEHIDVGHTFHIEGGFLTLLVRPQGTLKELWGDRNSLRKKRDEGGNVCFWTTIDPEHSDGVGEPKTRKHRVLFVKNDTVADSALVVCMEHDELPDMCDCRTANSHGGVAHVHP